MRKRGRAEVAQKGRPKWSLSIAPPPPVTMHPTAFIRRRRAAEAGVSNVKASVADGEALTGFGDGSVDAVTCTSGLMFMPDWQRAIKVRG